MCLNYNYFITSGQLGGTCLMETNKILSNTLSSLVVFFVSVPLCLGVAIASGVPASLGLLAGIVGGFAVSTIGGSSLQVTGPAGGLIAITLSIVDKYGFEYLAAFVIVAGLLQIIFALMKIGPWFQAVSPSVIYGMLSGIGVIVFGSQIQGMFDLSAKGSTIQQIVSFFKKLFEFAVNHDPSIIDKQAALIGLLTLALIFLWAKLKGPLSHIPPILVAVLVAVGISQVFNFDIKYIHIAENPFDYIVLPRFESLSIFSKLEAIFMVLTLAFLCSMQSILSTIALDKMAKTNSSNFNREMLAQGIGNLLCGFMGLIPICGVVTRGVSNVAAGASSRLSAVLQSLWMLLAILFFANYLDSIPLSCLAAVLIFISYRLMNFGVIKNFAKYGKIEVLIYIVTLVLIVSVDFTLGVVVGVLLSMFKFLSTYAYFECEIKESQKAERTNIFLRGCGAFFNIPKINVSLKGIPQGKSLHFKFGKLTYIDHAFFEHLTGWAEHYVSKEGSVFIEWDRLEAGITDSHSLKPQKKK